MAKDDHKSIYLLIDSGEDGHRGLRVLDVSRVVDNPLWDMSLETDFTEGKLISFLKENCLQDSYYVFARMRYTNTNILSVYPVFKHKLDEYQKQFIAKAFEKKKKLQIEFN